MLLRVFYPQTPWLPPPHSVLSPTKGSAQLVQRCLRAPYPPNPHPSLSRQLVLESLVPPCGTGAARGGERCPLYGQNE